MQRLLEDVRYALRQFRNNPGFTLTAVVTLALGIGANTAIFTLLDQALLRNLPVKDPAKLVLLRFTGTDRGHLNDNGSDAQDFYSYPMYRDFRDHSEVFSGMFCRYAKALNVTFNGRTERAAGELVSGTYFGVLGVRPSIGTAIANEDDQIPGWGGWRGPVVVLSHSFWSSRSRVGYYSRGFKSTPSTICRSPFRRR